MNCVKGLCASVFTLHVGKKKQPVPFWSNCHVELAEVSFSSFFDIGQIHNLRKSAHSTRKVALICPIIVVLLVGAT